MDEGHRFLRYVMPGALFLIEAFLLLIVLLPKWTVTGLGRLPELKNPQFLAALVVFLGSGGMGFLFSIIHHLSLSWERKVLRVLVGGVDHGPVIDRLRKKNLLYLSDADTGREVADGLSRHEAWVIVNAIWHERVSDDYPMVKGANPRAKTLADIFHSIGTARWGALFAPLLSFGVAYCVAERSLETNDIMRFFGAILLSGIIIYVHDRAYRRASDTAEKFAAEILQDTLTKSFWDSGRPERTFVDLPKRRKRDC